MPNMEQRKAILKKKESANIWGISLLHYTPALAKVVPPDETGSREVQGWKFHYNGWTPDEFDHQTFVRDDPSTMNLKPESCRGSLDVNMLKKHGCNGMHVWDDPLFFTNSYFHSATQI